MRFWLAVALLGLAAAAQAQPLGGDYDDGMDLNGIVDQVLEQTRAQVRQQGMDQLPLPDIYEKFKKKVGFVKITGHFEARDGWAKSIVSLRRDGDATMTMSDSGDRVYVDVPLTIGDLQIGFDHYKAKLGKLGPSGHLTAKVASNSLSLRASLHMTDETCSMSVDALKLNWLGKVDVHATGLGELNFLYSQIVTWVTAKLHDKIEEGVQNGIKNAINKAGLSLNCNTSFGR